METFYKLADYRLKELLGEGMFAEVYLGEHSDGLYAVKIIHKRKHRNLGTKHARKEIAALTRMGSVPGIVHLKEWKEDESCFFIVQTYCHGYRIDELPAPLSNKDILSTGLSILENLQKIHSLGVFHLDIKPSNVILSREGTHLIDFGCSFISSNGIVEMSRVPFEGTPAYMAPEMIKKADDLVSLELLDIWSFGCLLYYLAAGKNPFSSTSLYALYPKILQCSVKYKGVCIEIENICRKIFIRKPNNRITLKNLILLVQDTLASFPREYVIDSTEFKPLL